MKYTGAIIISVVIGTVYYEIMEKSIPTGLLSICMGIVSY